MNSHIVEDGRNRLYGNKDFRASFQARQQELQASIEAKYADELAAAGWLRRQVLRWRMAAEFRRERRKLVPSEASLFSNRRAED
jgi:hypothetical protein